MSAALETGQIEILFKAVGTGTASLARLQVDDTVSLIGPIGNQFVPHRQYPIRFLLGGGVGIPPMIFLAQQLKSQKLPVPYAFMGSEIPFPFTCAPTNLPVPGLDQPQFLAIEALQSLGIPNRLASLADLPGTFNGLVTDLAETVIKALSAQQRKQVELFACGPTPMLAAVAALARRYQMPCQVSLEEYMACAVGGCAGCVVEVSLPDGPAMKRVCVDGPIFAASEAFPAKPFSDPIEPVFE